MPDNPSDRKPWQTRGWLTKYLLLGDNVFGHGRLTWWVDAMADGGLPEGPIPEINFHGEMEDYVHPKRRDLPGQGKKTGLPLSPIGARKHVEQLLENMHFSWDAITFMIAWLHFGLALDPLKVEPPAGSYGPTDDWGDMLYRGLELGRFQAADADVLGAIIADRQGARWNPNAFYPTPMNLCKMITEMVCSSAGVEKRESDDTSEDPRLQSVMDPCVGSGRFLLAASNYSLNLWGVDIDPLLVKVCSVNCALFAPWAVYIPREVRAKLGRPTSDEAAAECADALVATAQKERRKVGHPPLPDGDEVNRHGQGELFSVEPREKRKAAVDDG